jgi:hypothetical protein
MLTSDDADVGSERRSSHCTEYGGVFSQIVFLMLGALALF